MSNKLNTWAKNITLPGVMLMELTLLSFAFLIAAWFPAIASLHWEWYIGVGLLILINPTIRFWGTKDFTAASEGLMELGVPILGLGMVSLWPAIFGNPAYWWIYLVAFLIFLFVSPYRQLLMGLEE